MNSPEPVMPFGKHKGKPFSEIPLWYFDWLVKQPDLKPMLREQIQKHLESNKLSKKWDQWKDNGK